MSDAARRRMCVALTLAFAFLAGDRVSAGAQFSNPVTLIVGTSPGAGYDLYGRIFANFYPRHLPGHPKIVVENMPVADGATAANTVYNASPKDGLILGMSPAGIVLTEILKPGKFSYRSAQLNWLGTISTITDVIAVYKSTGVQNIEDAKKKQVVLGAGGPLGPLSIFPTLSNEFLGTKFRIVEGYPGGQEINLAMDNGEVQGRDNQWDSWLAQRPNLIKDQKLNYLLQIGPKIPALAGVPELAELITNPDQRAMVELAELTELVGRSIYTAPSVSSERLATLRDAFDQTMQDPDFRQSMKKAGLDIFSRSGESLQADLTKTLASSKQIGAELRAVLNVD